MVNITTIPDGDTNWGSKARGNFAALSAAIDSVAANTGASTNPTAPAALVAAGVRGYYNSQTKVFNTKTSNTHVSRSKLMRAQAGVFAERPVIALVGDSTTGQYATGAYSADYLSKLLELAGVPVAGEMVSPNRGNNSLQLDERITVTGNWVALNQTTWLDSGQADAVSIVKFTSRRPGTIASLEYMANVPCQWRVDGGAWQSLSAVGLVPTTVSMTGLADALHTVEFSNLAPTGPANAVYVNYMGVYRANGVLVVNNGINGSASSDLRATNPWQILPSTRRLNPIMLSLNYGINDQNGGATVADSIGHMVWTFGQFSDATRVLEISNPVEGQDHTLWDQAKYRAAADNDYVLIDMNELFGDFATARADGLYVTGDGTHPNLAGYVLKAKARLAAMGLPS